MNALRPFLVRWKETPRSRKVLESTQFHPNATAATRMTLIRDNYPRAVLVAVSETNDPRKPV